MFLCGQYSNFKQLVGLFLGDSFAVGYIDCMVLLVIIKFMSIGLERIVKDLIRETSSYLGQISGKIF
mgnify:CR=1 FL=1